MDMQELNIDEATSLFLQYATCVPSKYFDNKDDYELVSSCVERCHFKKGDGVNYHYHPLALRTLGDQLDCRGYFPERWRSLLHDIDILLEKPNHPIFSILRSSFDALSPQDQLLFMDVVLFAPYINPSLHWRVSEWLGMVRGICVESVMARLENLKLKSLVDNVDDDFGRIYVHDLWREFVILELKASEFEKRRWTYEWDESNWHDDAILVNGRSSPSMKRLFIMEMRDMQLQDVMFSRFPSLTVLKLHAKSLCRQQLHLVDLKLLTSLELEYPKVLGPRLEGQVHPTGLGSLLKLCILRWSNIPSGSPCIDDISRLTNLQVLELTDFGGAPDLSSLVLLRVARFRSSISVVTIAGFSSNHTNLQFLDLSDCTALESYPGVGELVALQELRLGGCWSLKEVPNLQKLKKLRKLDVSGCRLLGRLPGLGDLVSLVELDAYGCGNLCGLLNMPNVENLRLSDISDCGQYEPFLELNEMFCVQYPEFPVPRIPVMCEVCTRSQICEACSWVQVGLVLRKSGTKCKFFFSLLEFN